MRNYNISPSTTLGDRVYAERYRQSVFGFGRVEKINSVQNRIRIDDISPVNRSPSVVEGNYSGNKAYFIKRLDRMKIFTLLLLILFLSGHRVFSQEECGVKLTPKQIAFEKANPRLPAAKSAVPQCCLEKTLSLTIWIVKDSSGQPNVSPADIQQSVDNLNSDFTPICLSFNVCAINYIDDWNYDSLYFPDEGGQLTALYQTPKTINVYLTRIINSPPLGIVCGLGGGSIWLSKACLTGKTFSHEMGHFFGLNHTFETGLGIELANGSNCATAGDLICDTPADPQGEAGADCQLDPYTQDPNGDWYVPLTGNIMSYYGNCRCGFTTEQYDRMCQQYLSFHSDLW